MFLISANLSGGIDIVVFYVLIRMPRHATSGLGSLFSFLLMVFLGHLWSLNAYEIISIINIVKLTTHYEFNYVT